MLFPFLPEHTLLCLTSLFIVCTVMKTVDKSWSLFFVQLLRSIAPSMFYVSGRRRMLGQCGSLQFLRAHEMATMITGLSKYSNSGGNAIYSHSEYNLTSMFGCFLLSINYWNSKTKHTQSYLGNCTADSSYGCLRSRQVRCLKKYRKVNNFCLKILDFNLSP